MKEWFCCHEESITIGREYEPWKIPSGGIVTWESPDRFCDHVMPKQRYAIMMGEQVIDDGFIREVRMLEITPIKKIEISNSVKKEWDSQTTFTHIFRYERSGMVLIGEWNENHDFTIPVPKENWIQKVKFMGTIEDNGLKISIEGIPI